MTVRPGRIYVDIYITENVALKSQVWGSLTLAQLYRNSKLIAILERTCDALKHRYNDYLCRLYNFDQVYTYVYCDNDIVILCS